VLSKQHYTKPITSQDKVMSERHLANRDRVSKMKNGPAKEKASKFYNLNHAKEHLLALGPTGKKVAKAIVKIQKKSGLMSLGSVKA